MIWLPVVGNYADIDVYASIIAYADLLNQRNKPAKVYIPMAPNYSVPAALRIPEQENHSFNLQPSDQAIILDISIPEVINRLVPDHQILEIIDHHPGYEQYWHEHIGDKAIIEPIGAVATSIFEWWGECWDYAKMSPQIAKLLLAAILDNTLNFNANITTDRDRTAASKLAKIAEISLEDFTLWYFSTVSETILINLRSSLFQDCKTVNISNAQPVAFCQLTLWDAQSLILESTKVHEIMNSEYKNWIVSIICISERKNYFLTSSARLSKAITKTLNLQETNDWLTSDRLYLRKEIIPKLS